MHHDAVELVEREWPTLADLADAVERRVIAADAGIELERHPHRLPLAAKPGAERVEIEAVGRARERGAESSIRRLEHIADAGEASLRQQCAIEPALRRAAGMHALDHGAILRGHQAGGLSARDAERMHGLPWVKLETARGTGGCREHAERCSRVPTL